MISIRSILTFLPFLHYEDVEKRQLGSANSSSPSLPTHTNYVTSMSKSSTSGKSWSPKALYRTATDSILVPSYAPLKPARTRCYSSNSCVQFSYPAVILERGAHVSQAVCPSDDEIIITFSDEAAFITAESWPMANLVLIGHDYPGCGPPGTCLTGKSLPHGQHYTYLPLSAAAHAQLVKSSRR